MDFSEVKAITIPEGNVYRILSGSTVLWKKTRLPDEYQQVEYIESSGTQYIDTGVLATSGLSMDEKMSYVAVPNDACFVGAKRGTTRIYLHHTWPFKFAYGYNYWYSSDITAQKDVVYNIHTDLNVGSQRMLVDSVEVKATSVSNEISLPYTIYIFCMNESNSPKYFTSGRLYSLTLYSDGEIVRDFVPCYRRSDNVAGLYDLANGVFYTNAGTGEFNVGADVIVLPNEYQRVEYIQGTSNTDGTNYINTLEYAKNTTRMELVCEITGFPNQYERLYGVRGAFWVMQYSTTSYRFYLDKPDRATLLKTQALSSDTEYVIVQDGGTTYLDGVQIATSSQAFDTETNPDMTYAPDGKIWLNADNGGNRTNSHLKIKSCMIWQNSVLTKHFVPCYRISDNKPGLYDLVNDVFYTNAGTGTFTVGSDI